MAVSLLSRIETSRFAGRIKGELRWSRHTYPVALGCWAVREGVVVLRNQFRRVLLLGQNRKRLGRRQADGGTGRSTTHVTDHVYQTGDVVLSPKRQRGLLGALTCVRLASAQRARTLPLLRNATAEFRDELSRLRASALISDGFGGKILTILGRPDAPGHQPFSRPLSLKRSQAQASLRKLHRSRALLRRSQGGLNGQHHA